MLRKKNFLVVTILILLVFLVTGCSGFLPKPTKGVISGRVLIPPTAKQLSKDISGWVGAAGAEVTIVDANGVKHTVITDENGYYNFENIAVKANTVVTATVKVDGKTMVLKTVIDKAVGKEQKYDSGAMTPESTALAIVVEHIQDVGGIVNLDEIKETDSYLDLLGKVTEVLEAQGNVEDDAGVQDLADEAVDEILYPDDGTPPPPNGGGPTTIAVSAISVEGVVDDLFVGTVLTAKTAPSGANVNYQWLRASEINTDDEDYEPIDEATGKTYELTADDAGNYIKVKAEGKGRYKGTVISEEAVGPVETLVPGELTIEYNYNDEEETKTVQYIARDRAYEKLTLPVGAALRSLTVNMDGVESGSKNVAIRLMSATEWTVGEDFTVGETWGTLEWYNNSTQWQLKSAGHDNYQDLQKNEYELQATFISKTEKELTVAIEVEVGIETIEASIDYNAVWNPDRKNWYIEVTVPEEDLDDKTVNSITRIKTAGVNTDPPAVIIPDGDKVLWFSVAGADGKITLKGDGEYAYKVVRQNDSEYIFNFEYVAEEVQGVSTADFDFTAPDNLVAGTDDIEGFTIKVSNLVNLPNSVDVRYLMEVALDSASLEGKVIGYGDSEVGTFTITDGKAYFGPANGLDAVDLEQLATTEGITTPFTVKNGLAAGTYKFTVGIVNVIGDVKIIASQEFEFEVIQAD